MKSKITSALVAGIIGTIGLTCFAGTARAAISSISGQSFAQGEALFLSFDGSNLSVSTSGGGWMLLSQAARPPFPFDLWDTGEPASLSLTNTWYSYTWSNSFLSAGDMVDSSTDFGARNITNSLEAYVGIRVNTETSHDANDGGIHFGWVKLSYDSASGAGELLAASINTVAGEGIAVPASAIPEPSSNLALLGLITSGLLLRRRSKRSS